MSSKPVMRLGKIGACLVGTHDEDGDEYVAMCGGEMSSLMGDVGGIDGWR